MLKTSDWPLNQPPTASAPFLKGGFIIYGRTSLMNNGGAYGVMTLKQGKFQGPTGPFLAGFGSSSGFEVLSFLKQMPVTNRSIICHKGLISRSSASLVTRTHLGVGEHSRIFVLLRMER